MDLSTAQAHLNAWLAADLNPAISVRTSDGKMVTYPSPDQIRDNIDYWQRQVLALTAQAAGGSGELSVRTPLWR